MSLVALGNAENSAILLHPDDNVAVARVQLSPGLELRVGGRPIAVLDPVPVGHKIALTAIPAGEVIRRYGQIMGRASRPIDPGRHVHTHNVAFEEIAFDYEFPEGNLPLPTPASQPVFLGYPREDGRAGTRNYIAVMAASNCAAHTAELIARSYEGEALPPAIDGVVAFPHGEGCGQALGPDIDQLQRTLGGVLDHPNVAGAIILGLGCEVNQIGPYLGNPRLAGLTVQESGGTRGTVEAARREIRRLMDAAAPEQRVETPASKLVLGLNCGGSDSFSGITANPALGVCSDLLAGLGATVVLAETPEVFGAEHLLVRRARNRQVAEKLLSCIRHYKEYLNRFGETFDDNPSPGNKAGGLTNILEKSLGAVAKAGASPMMDVVEYAERIHCPGFVFMNTPGYDPVSLAGLAAGGVNLIAFTTGRGSVIGFPTVPVLKIASNTATWNRMRENMDVNAGLIAEGVKTVQEVGAEIFNLLLRVASGERTAAERFSHQEFVPWRIGPVL
ncbi:MAG: altronate dehydratase family protein [Bryobacteraceae bacterium]|jgi:altronate hydrolase